MNDGRPDGPVARSSHPASAGPSPAATIVLLRPARWGREVLLLRRPPASAFAPDAWVFPGGRVDQADRDLDYDRLADGPSPAEWAAALALGDGREAAAYVVAAMREAWEETGILLTTAGHRPAGCDQARQELLGDTDARGVPRGCEAAPRFRAPPVHRSLDHPRMVAAALRYPLLRRRGRYGNALRARRRGAGGLPLDAPGTGAARGGGGRRSAPPPDVRHTPADRAG